MKQELASNLRRLRERAKLSQQTVATALSVPRSAVSEIEGGRRDVSAAELVTLSRLYDETLEALVGLAQEKDDVDVMLRAAAVTDVVRMQLIRWITLCETYAQLEKEAGEVLVAELRPPSRVLSTFEQAHELADEERRRLGLGLTPGHQLLQVLEERVGIKALYLELDDNISGASALGDRFGPAILVNSTHPPGRRAFTLAHEFFHLVTNGRVAGSPAARSIHLCEPQTATQKKDRGEQLADQFAGRLLLPPVHFVERLQALVRNNGTIDKLDLVSVAHYFGVSVQAVFVQLAVMGIVPWGLAREGYDDPALRERIAATTADGDQFPLRFGRLVAKAYDAGSISRGRVAELLGINIADVEVQLRRFGAGGGDGGIKITLPR